VDLAICDLDPLGKRAQMVTTIAAAVDAYPLARRPGEPLDHCGVMACWPDVTSIAEARATSACA
jgi:hypothetical protein